MTATTIIIVIIIIITTTTLTIMCTKGPMVPLCIKVKKCGEEMGRKIL